MIVIVMTMVSLSFWIWLCCIFPMVRHLHFMMFITTMKMRAMSAIAMNFGHTHHTSAVAINNFRSLIACKSQ